MNYRLFLPIMLFSLSTHIQATEPLQTIAAGYKNLPREIQLDGVVEAVNQGTVSSQTQGQVIEVFFDVDDHVEEGKIIVRLNDSTHQVVLRQAKAELGRVVAQLDDARKDLVRLKKIFAKKLVSQAKMDQATTTLKSARANWEAAKSGVAAAREQLAFTVIKAPFSGIVTQRHIEMGETANSGSLLMSGISLDKLRVKVDVPQRLIAQVREYQHASIETPKDGLIRAESLTIFPFAHAASKTFRVRLKLPENLSGIMPGMYIKVSFVIGDEDFLLIPKDAVVYRSEVTGVYVVDKQTKVHLRRIRVGHEVANDMIVVRAGLEEGELISIDPIKAGIELKRQSKGKSNE